MDVLENIKKLGYQLPETPMPGGIYSQVREFGECLCYVSGAGPNVTEKNQYFGKFGSEYDLKDGEQIALDAVLNMLAILHKNLGDLNRIEHIVKILCFVACENNFYFQPEVANYASKLLIDIFGEDCGKAARSAIGTNVLPGNIPFEIEALVELKNKEF